MENKYLTCGISSNCKLKVNLISKETNMIGFNFTSGDNQDIHTSITIHGMNKKTIAQLQEQLEYVKSELTC